MTIPIPLNLKDRVSLMTWPKGQVIHRIHPSKYGSAQFNDTNSGNARFSPISDVKSEIIPTIYGGSEFDCAAMETVFHDIPHTSGLTTLEKIKISDLAYSEISCDQDLRLIDLKAVALRRFGLQRRDIIDTDKSEYPHTRSWAEAFHAQCTDAQGLCWQSKQADHTQAIVLFGDRVPVGSLSENRLAVGVVHSPTYAMVLRLSQAIGVLIV